ncbi:hypothetical protein GCM10011352_34990 [Marinobacterium zhoushanense]|uniref:Rhodanese domain-containing protein n=1 Tax=Marinobacterium zhoushanense TaxID=1679163 RepID=A0ABQ1KRR1_9GAMM|nr:rhodanese-like domain-containing protein [Marinobacterium zhoushanense]GGC05792.1 hypothetical protein GCM10011352_34990 [Marinobacterium zhoushanense]
MDTTLWTPKNLLALLAALFAVAWMMMPNTVRYNIEEVDVANAKNLIDAGAVVIDVRPTGKYDGRHIPGALSIPLEVLTVAVPAALEAVKSQRIVVYCGDGSTLGPRGTQVLNEAGYPGAVNLKGGIGGWADAGYPVRTGS